jgi:hypothetical protein
MLLGSGALARQGKLGLRRRRARGDRPGILAAPAKVAGFVGQFLGSDESESDIRLKVWYGLKSPTLP